MAMGTETAMESVPAKALVWVMAMELVPEDINTMPRL